MIKRRPSRWRLLTDGIILENPLLILMIGLCPALATSLSARDGLGMGVCASFVIISSNIIVSSLRKIIPQNVRIPVFIIIISTFVTLVDYLLQAYQPSLYQSLGVFVPLIVVNCIVLGRAEAFAYHNRILDSFLDGLGKSLGFTLVLFLMGAIREFLAQGTLFGQPTGISFLQSQGALFFIFPPGGFLLIGLLKALVNKYIKRGE